MNQIFYIIAFTGLAVLVKRILYPTTGTEAQLLTALWESIDKNLTVVVPVTLEFGDIGFVFPDLVSASQIQVDSQLRNIDQEQYKVILIDKLHVDPRRIKSSPPESNEDLSVDYSIELVHASENYVVFHEEEFKAFNFYTSSAIHENDLPFFLTQCILSHLLNNDLKLLSSKRPTYYRPEINVNLVTIFLEGDEYIEIPLAHHCDDFFEPFVTGLREYSSVRIHQSVLNTTERTLAEDIKLFERNNSLALFYTHTSNELRLRQLIPTADVSYFPFATTPIAKEDVWPFLYHAKSAITALLEIPMFPRENLRVKLWSMKKHNTIRFLADSVSLLIKSTDGGCTHGLATQLRKEIESAVTIVIAASVSHSQPDWDILFQRSWTLLERVQAHAKRCQVQVQK